MAKKSRTKGRRGEQEVATELRRLGFQAERILRQYAKPGEPDIYSQRDGKIFTFEVKYRAKSFQKIYDIWDARPESSFAVAAFAVAKDGTYCLVKIALDVNALLGAEENYAFYDVGKKTVNKIFALKEMKQGADFLVIKDDYKPRLYLQFK